MLCNQTGLGSNSNSFSEWLCDPGEVMLSLSASASSPEDEAYNFPPTLLGQMIAVGMRRYWWAAES